MSLKLIEMQIAVPRTVDSGRLQEQLQQRGQNMVDHANEMVKKEAEFKRINVNKNEESAKAEIKKEEKNNQHQKEHHKNDDQGIDDQEQKEQHPYKGKIIDYIR